MSPEPLNENELAALRGFDTPTVCNALEILAPERRGFGYTVQPLVCAFPALPPMVGYARTATARTRLHRPSPRHCPLPALTSRRVLIRFQIRARRGREVMVTSVS